MTDTSSYRYWAFISYSSKDKPWARWLHRAIETYGIPARLVSHPTPTGEPAPKRLRPLFHDRAELPASSDLGAQIEGALRASRYLIVICSPHAAQSMWVNKEVETFLRMGRPDRVLAVIVDGEPRAGDERECFPPALRNAEPIAADARRAGDGKGNAKLKLLAGMLGVGFDGLKQRDTQRRLRRLELAIGLTLILAAGFAGLALYANQQRSKAVVARQQAENILEYLLYDLDDKLAPVGRLDIVRDVQSKVDAYYRELGVESRNPTALRNQSTAFANKGERLQEQGDLKGALGEYRAALEVLEQLALTDPDNSMWQRDISMSHLRTGDVFRLQGDLEPAANEYRAAAMITDRLASSRPSDADLQRDVSVAHMRLGEVLVLPGIAWDAMKEYQTSLQVIDRLVSSNPNNGDLQRDALVGHLRLGELFMRGSQPTEALREYRAALPAGEHLVTVDPKNMLSQRDLALVHYFIGDILKRQNEFKGALGEFESSLTINCRLAAYDTSNVEWQRDVALSTNGIGDVLLAEGNLTEALEAYRTSLVIHSRLTSSDPSNTDSQRDESIAHEEIGSVLQQQSDFDGALREFKISLELSKRLLASDPTNGDLREDVNRVQNIMDGLLKSQHATDQNVPDQWDKYKPRTLAQIINMHLNLYWESTKPAETASSKSRHTENIIVSADPMCSKVSVTYLGASRLISSNRKWLIDHWVTRIAAKPRNIAQLFETEILVKEGAGEYWLPIQKQVLPYLEKAIRKGSEVDLLIVFVGAIQNSEEPDFIFLINEFDE